MKRVMIAGLGVGLVFALAVAAEAGFSAGLSATIVSENVGANTGDWMQVGQIATNPNNNANNYAFGTFTSYSADLSLPQITGNDLNKYGFAMDGTIGAINGHTVTYTGQWWILAPGYGFSSTTTQSLEHGTFDFQAVFATNWATADVTGSMLADPGTQKPTGWPVPVDWSSANPGYFQGEFVSGYPNSPNTGTLTGTLDGPVPEPATIIIWSLLGGLGIAIAHLRRRAGVVFHRIGKRSTGRPSGWPVFCLAATLVEIVGDKGVSAHRQRHRSRSSRLPPHTPHRSRLQGKGIVHGTAARSLSLSRLSSALTIVSVRTLPSSHEN